MFRLISILCITHKYSIIGQDVTIQNSLICFVFMNPLAEDFVKYTYSFVLRFQLKLKIIIHSKMSATVMEIKLYLNSDCKSIISKTHLV